VFFWSATTAGREASVCSERRILQQMAGSSPFLTISAARQEVFEDKTVRKIMHCVIV